MVTRAALAMLLPFATVSAAASAPTSLSQQSPFLGLWELDLTRMPDNYGPPPKRVTYRFEDASGGQWRTRVEITAPDGSVRRIAVQYRRDGRAARGEGYDAEADSAAFAAPAANVLVMSLARGGAPAGTRVYTISPDGREMTEAAAGVDGEGAPFVRTFHFKRVG